MASLLPSDRHAAPPRPFDDLLSEEALQALLATIYPSRHSLKWAIRKHRELLAQERALFIINGRNWIDPNLFVKAIADAGHRAALESVKGVAVVSALSVRPSDREAAQ